jgi:hypothetical protein
VAATAKAWLKRQEHSMSSTQGLLIVRFAQAFSFLTVEIENTVLCFMS